MRDEIKRPQPEKKDFGKEEMETRSFVFITSDREGWIGETEMKIDPRWEWFDVNYLPLEMDKGNGYPFEDDHIRQINQHFKIKRGKTAGRDDRHLKIGRTEEAQERLDTLKTRKEELENKIRVIKKDKRFFNPKEIIPTIESKERMMESFDVNKDKTEKGMDKSYYVVWQAIDNEVSDPIYGKRAVNTSSEAYFDIEEAKEAAGEPLTPEMKQELQKLKQEFKEFCEESGYNELSSELEEIMSELDEFSTGKINTDIRMFPPGSNRAKELQKKLGTERFLMHMGSMDDLSDKELSTKQDVKEDTPPPKERKELLKLDETSIFPFGPPELTLNSNEEERVEEAGEYVDLFNEEEDEEEKLSVIEDLLALELSAKEVLATPGLSEILKPVQIQAAKDVLGSVKKVKNLSEQQRLDLASMSELTLKDFKDLGADRVVRKVYLRSIKKLAGDNADTQREKLAGFSYAEIVKQAS